MEKILLIEDNEALRENTAEILTLADYVVTTAENGKIGVEMAIANPPDLIICDIMMPVLDGYGVFQIVSTFYAKLRHRTVTTNGSTRNVQKN